MVGMKPHKFSNLAQGPLVNHQNGPQKQLQDLHGEEQLTQLEEEIVTNTDLNQSHPQLPQIQQFSSSKKMISQDTLDNSNTAKHNSNLNQNEADGKTELKTLEDKCKVQRRNP